MVKNLSVNADARHEREAGLIPRSGRSPGKANGNPLQYSCLENTSDRGTWQATVHRVTELDTTESTLACYHPFNGGQSSLFKV